MGSEAGALLLRVDAATGIVLEIGGEVDRHDLLGDAMRHEITTRRLLAGRWGEEQMERTLSAEGLALARLAGRWSGLPAVQDLTREAVRSGDGSDPSPEVVEQLWRRVEEEAAKEKKPVPDREEWESGLRILWRYWLARRAADAGLGAVPEGREVEV